MTDACTSTVANYDCPSFSPPATVILAEFADANVGTDCSTILEADDEKEKMAAEILNLKS